jgi:integrase
MPRAAPTRSAKLSTAFGEIVKTFIDQYAKPKNRRWWETERIFNTYVLPQWRDLDITEIRRAMVAQLLDDIVAKKLKHPKTKQPIGGTVTADHVLVALSKLFAWYAARSDEFMSPIVRGMRRAPAPKERARQQVLTDAELRALWAACAEEGVVGAVTGCMLLTVQRARRVGKMRRSEIVDGVWHAAHEDDPKNKGVAEVPLSALAREIIANVPVIVAPKDEAQDYVFSVNGVNAFEGWSKAKARLHAAMLAKLSAEAGEPVKIAPWQFRDLRRTARTLMSRAGVSFEIAEPAWGT